MGDDEFAETDEGYGQNKINVVVVCYEVLNG